jgi:glycerophosphoryl diester phosphodiesterase
MSGTPAVFAHRGYSGRYPENTMVAFAKALELGVDALELDVRLTRDGALAVIHDATVDRTSSGAGMVRELTLAQLREFDAGSWFSPIFAGERHPSLQDVLDRVGGLARLNVHVKASDTDREVIISRVVQELESRDLLASSYLASDQFTVARAKDLDPRVEICNLTVEPRDTYIDRSLCIGCRILQPRNGMVTSQFMEEAHGNSMEVNPFYADEEGEMRRLISLGVDGILTNYPDRLIDLLRGQ